MDDLLLRTLFPDSETLRPVVVQEVRFGNVLMVGYMNRAALDRTLETKTVTFFSRSKGRLWTKGESSGHTLDLVALRYDCDADTLLALSRPQGPTCHTGTASCFDGRPLSPASDFRAPFETLGELAETIRSRRGEDPEKSYVAKLLLGPLAPLLKKLVEEAGETMAAVYEHDQPAIRSEMADLLFHLLLAMERTGTPWEEVLGVLQKRSGKSGIEEKKERTGSPTEKGAGP